MINKRLTDAQYNKVRNIQKRKLSIRLYPFFLLLSKILNLSYDFFLLNLREKKPKIYSIQVSDQEIYETIQIEGNLRKFDRSGVESDWLNRLNPITKDIKKRNPMDSLIVKELKGACMGARNGSEVLAFESLLKVDYVVNVIGTDISPTAKTVKKMIVHDFHKPLPKECGAMDFIYSNSLDQANNPRLALESWLHSLSPTGCIYLEMQRGHGKQSTSLLDPFSCEIELFPYVLLQWDMDGYIEKIIYPDQYNSTYGIFVIKPIVTLAH